MIFVVDLEDPEHPVVKSAPENPGVCFDKNSTSKFVAFFNGLK